MPSNRCIWCLLESTDSDREHIFPEALGCPDHLTLPGSVVCKSCNNGLAHLDRIVSDDFDFLTVMNGINRKKGRPAEVSSRGNVYASSTPDGPNIFFNLESSPRIAPTGQTINPFRGRPRDIKPDISTLGSGATTISFAVQFGQHKKFARGLYKIALNSIAYMQGSETALHSRFDWIRRYVRKGGEARKILLAAAPDTKYILAAYPPWHDTDGEQAMELRIAMASFLLDLSANEKHYEKIVEQAKIHFGEGNFSLMPPDA